MQFYGVMRFFITFVNDCARVWLNDIKTFNIRMWS